MTFRILIILSVLAVTNHSLAQVSQGGKPYSFGNKDISQDIPSVDLPVPIDQIGRALEDNSEFPLQTGVGIPVDLSMINSGIWDTLEDGSLLWRLSLKAEGAKALGTYFDAFWLPEHSRLFVYDIHKRYVAGAFTSANNSDNGSFAIQLIPGDHLILEYFTPSPLLPLPDLHISEIAYNFRDAGVFPEGSTSSDWCEVNINCSPEGDDWQRQKKGVAKIYVKEGAAYFWCSGSLVNTTREDRTPYFLTADHCGDNSSAADYQQWIFYFNYELPGCTNQATPPSQTMAGATLLANAGTSGSDFKLLLLSEDVPEIYNPYFNGWNNENIGSSSGVSIHHPSGDVRKISTYTQPLLSSSWASGEETHWQVYWAPTANGHGVTEGGSSGGPIFNEEGLIIGTLTGGLAACDEGGGGPGTGPDKPDYYGKFSYSWDENGTEPAMRLKDWLDPDNTGITELHGIGTLLEADFDASETILLIGESVDFTNLTAGNATEFQWLFEGAIPGTSSEKEPQGILYPKGGFYDVTLIVSDGLDYDTLTRNDYIHALGTVYPNPASDNINIYLGDEALEDFTLEVFDVSGKVIITSEVKDNPFRVFTIDISSLTSGQYVLRLATKERYYFYDFVKVSK